MKKFIALLFAFMATMFLGVFSAIGSAIGAVDNLPIANPTAYNIRSLHDFHFKKSVMAKL